MANCAFGWPIYSDVGVLYTPTLSGGSWSSTLPLTNLQDRRLARVARSSDVQRTSTIIECNLISQRQVGIVAIPKHTISSAGKVRVRGYSGFPFKWARDFSTGWSSVGTPTRSADAFTGSNGVPMDLIGDDSGAALEGYTQVYAFTGDATKIVTVTVKQGTSTSSVIRVRDTSASANRLLATITWSAGLPSLAMTTGSFVSYTTVATGVYRLVFLTASVTAANTNQVEIYPATTSALATANTGDLYVCDVEAYNAAVDSESYDSGYLSVFPVGLTAEDVVGLNVPFVVVPPSTISVAKSWRIEIDDTTNSAGYVDLSRLIIAGLYQPTVNMSYGAGMGLETATSRMETDGGAARFYQRPVRRTVSLVLEEIQESEAWATFWKMQKQLGTSGQVFFCWDTADTTYRHDRSFLGVFRVPSGLEQATYARFRGAVQLVEEL